MSEHKEKKRKEIEYAPSESCILDYPNNFCNVGFSACANIVFIKGVEKNSARVTGINRCPGRPL